MNKNESKTEKVKKVKEIPGILGMVEKTFRRAKDKNQNALATNKATKIKGQEKLLEYREEFEKNNNLKHILEILKEEAKALGKRAVKFLDEHKGQLLAGAALGIFAFNIVTGIAVDRYGKNQDVKNKVDGPVASEVIKDQNADKKEKKQEANETQEKDESKEQTKKGTGINKGNDASIAKDKKANDPTKAPAKGGTEQNESEKVYKDNKGGTQTQDSQQRQQQDINQGKKSEKLKEEEPTEKTTDYSQGQEKNNEGAKEGLLNNETGKVVKDENGPTYGEKKVDVTKAETQNKDTQTSVSNTQQAPEKNDDDWLNDLEW